MNNLTTIEKKVLNNVSRTLNPQVSLGDKLDEILSASGSSGTPVNAVAATGTLTVSGVSVDGETITIGTDVYEFLADAAQTKTAPTNIAINITANTVNASGTLTVDTQPISGDTFTIGAKTYIFVPVGTANGIGEISIGIDLAGAKTAIVAAINGTDGVNTPHPTVSAAAFVVNASVLTALIGGTIGNTIATTETFTAITNIFSAATLGSGTDCSIVDTIFTLLETITASDTQGVGATDGVGDTVILTADIAGASGNTIIIGETMANAVFTAAAVLLTGGVDGTVATGMQFLMDASYLYVSPTGNTVSEANWRRVSIGTVY